MSVRNTSTPYGTNIRIRAIRFAIVASLTFVTTSTFGADQREWSQITKQLQAIKAVSGNSVASRITACGITIDRNTSWTETAIKDYAQIHAVKGDTIMEIFIDVPLIPGQNPEAYRGLVARWVIHDGEAHPESGWANRLQNKSPPIGSLAWMNC